jgi:nucleoside phosphorylase
MDNIPLVTVLKVEAQAVLDTSPNATGQPWERKLIDGKTYYSLGQVGGVDVFMVQSEMGTATPGGALITVHKAIEDPSPAAVIMVGIAFGTRPDKQQLGDILVAKQIMAYEPGKVKGKFILWRSGDSIHRIIR